MRKEKGVQECDASGDATKNKSPEQNLSSSYFHHSN